MLEPLDPRDRFTLQAEKDFRASVRPIYSIKHIETRPEHIGSCLLLKIDGIAVVSTAAHIMDQLAEGPVFVGSAIGASLVPMVDGTIRSTTAPQGNRRLDHVDCAFLVPPSSAIAAMGSVEFLDESRFSRELPTPSTLYTAFGYPVSRNKKAIDHPAKTIDTRISMYTANVEAMPDLATKLGVSGEEHFFLSFEERSFSGDGATQNTFSPKGLSGGALLRLE